MLVHASNSTGVATRRGPRLALVLIVLSLGISAADQVARTTDGPPHRVLPVADGGLSLECLVRKLMGLPCLDEMPEPEPEPEPEPDPGTEPDLPVGPVQPLI
jgi:hypothetical protein